MASFQKYQTKQGQLWMFKMDTGINPETGKGKLSLAEVLKQRKRHKLQQLNLNRKLKTGCL